MVSTGSGITIRRTGGLPAVTRSGSAVGARIFVCMLGEFVSYVDPYGLWAEGDPLPQSVVDFSAGFGDTITSGFGLFDTSLTQLTREGF